MNFQNIYNTEAKIQFPTIAFYLEGRKFIEYLINSSAENLVEKDIKLSSIRAKEIVAAQIFYSFGIEWETLDNIVKLPASDDYYNLYDKVIELEEKDTIQNMLCDLSGTRTLLSDMPERTKS